MTTLNITLQPKQKIALAKSETTPVLFYGGAKGGGKSYLVRAHEVIRRLKYPHSKGLIVRKTYPELLSNHIRQFLIEYPAVVPWYNASEKAIHWPNGSVTEFSHLSSTMDVYTYQGREYQDIKIDEITQHEEEVFKILRSSLRTTDPNIKPRMLLTGNPGGIGHLWVKRIFIDRDFKDKEKPEDFGFVQASVWDNRALMDADPDYIRRLQDLPDDKRKAYLEGDWNIFAGQYFGEWRPSLHIVPAFVPAPNDDRVFVGGLDWGREKPFAVTFDVIEKIRTDLYPDFYRSRTFLEVYGTNKTPKEWAREISSKLFNFGLSLDDIAWIRCDNQIFNVGNDMGRSIADQFIDYDSRYRTLLQPASKDRISGWENLHNWLSLAPDGLPYWQIGANCVNLIRTLPALIHDENKVEDVDSTGEDHAPDAERYQKKHLKWIDAKLGGLKTDKQARKINPIVQVNDQGQEIAIDLTKFEPEGESERVITRVVS